MSIKVKRGLAINLPTLEEGELGFTTDSYEMYVGSDNGNILLNNGEILIRRNNGMLQYAQSSRKNQWFDICSLEEIRGDQGIQGIQGIQGVKGDKGDKGERGIQGEKGNPFTYADFTPDQLRALKGEKGDTGAKGERGLTGDKGDRGVGLNYAWSGTRLGVKLDTDAQYTYVDLRGADGKDGKQGERGERGIQGEKGETPSIAHLEKQVSDKSKELDTKFNTLTAKQQQDAEVVTARDGEVSLNARLERDLKKGKIHFVDIEGSNISTESQEGYLENVEILGNTWQDAENLADIRSVGDKVEGQELYEIPVLSCGKNLYNMKNLEQYILSESDGMYEVNLYTDMYNNGIFVPTHNNIQHSVSIKAKLGTARNFRVDFVYENGEFNSIGYITTNSQFTEIKGVSRADNKLAYIRFNWSTAGTVFIKYFQIEEGTQATPYEPYQEERFTILSPVQLEEGDILKEVNGVWGVEKVRVKLDYTNLPSIANGNNYDSYNTFMIRFRIQETGLNLLPRKLNVSNLVPSIEGGIWAKDIECVCLEDVNYLDIRINKSKLTDVSNNGALKYLQDNKFYAILYLAQPTFIPLPHSQQIKLRTFADRTYISFDTEIQPTLKAQVPKSLGATVNTHTTQIDNLNKELDRVKKLEESTVSTITSYKAFTTIAETTSGYFEDVKIEGKTLVNCINTITKDLSKGANTGNIPLYKPSAVNSMNTLVFKVSNINLDSQSSIEVLVRGYDVEGNFKPTSVDNILKVDKNGIACFKWKDTISFNGLILGVASNNKNNPSFTISDIMLLEGDHTDKDLSYFEGLKSVGQGVDEISVESVNENLFDLNKVHADKTSIIGNDIIITNNYATAIGVTPRQLGLIANKQYIISRTIKETPASGYATGRVALIDEGGSIKSLCDYHVETNSFTLTSKELDFKFLLYGNPNSVTTFTDMYIGLDIPPSKPCIHKSNKKQILYYNPTTQTWEKPVLREWDSIEKHSDGKYYYHKRSGEVVFDGSDSYWWSIGGEGDTINGLTVYTTFTKAINGSSCVSDKLKNLTANTHIGNTDFVLIGTNTLVLNVSKSKLSTQDVQGFKQWLQTNPVTVVYQLAKEEVYECTNLDLITYSGETNLIVNSGVIQPKITLKVLSNVSNVVKLLQEKVSILENKFIKGLQQVLAGDMMSLAHLLYPEDFTLENDTPQVIPYIEEGDINE